MPKDDILAKMDQLRPKLSNRRRKACQYIIENPLAAGNMSLSELADNCGVGSATIMRLVVEDLQMESFVVFKRMLRSAYVSRQESSYSMYQQRQMNLLRQRAETVDHPSAAMLSSIPEYLQSLQTPEFWSQLERAVQLLVEAKRIFVIGLRSAESVSTLFESEIGQLTGNVVQLSRAQEMVFDRAMEMTQEDVLFVLSNWPYTKRTIDVAEFACVRKIPFILETNVANHPLEERAAAVLNSNSVNLPYHTLATTLMIELLSCEIRRRVRPHVDRLLPEMEQLLDAMGIEVFEHQRRE